MPKFLLNAKIKKCSRFTGGKKKTGFNIENPPISFPSTAFYNCSSTTGINKYIPKAGALTK